jgi:hypothetical protein
MAEYPPELHKKVTLLRHFRNYLIDQQRSENGEQITDMILRMKINSLIIT